MLRYRWRPPFRPAAKVVPAAEVRGGMWRMVLVPVAGYEEEKPGASGWARR